MFFLVLWLISPMALIPLFIIYLKKSQKYAKENARLKNIIEALKRDNANYQRNVTYHGDNQPVSVEPVIQTVPTEPVIQTVPAEPVAQSVPAEPTESISKEEKTDTTRTINVPLKEKKDALNRGTVLFGLGVFFVLLSGVIFATTTWQVLSSYGKVGTLLAAVVVFYVSSFIAKEKLGLRETGITFFLLGSGFLSIINLSIGYFKWFSESYSFNGTTGYLVAGISMVILTICLIVGGKLYNMPALVMASEILSVADVVVLSLFFTDNIGIVMLVTGLYLWLLFGLLFFYEYRNGKAFLLKALVIISYLYMGVTIVAVFAADFIWACIILVVALLMFIPKIYLDEKKRNISIVLFDVCFALYAVLLAFRTDIDVDIREAAVFVVMAMAFELFFRLMKLPTIGTIRNRISDWCSFAILAIGFILTIYEGGFEYEKDVLLMHTVHVYASLMVFLVVMLFEILKSREASEADKICMYCKTFLVLATVGWVNEKYYGIENLVAFALIVSLYFVWRVKLKKQEEKTLAVLFAAVSVICGIVTAIVCVNGSKQIEKIVVAVLLAVLYYIAEKEKKYVSAGIVMATMYTVLVNLEYEISAPANLDLNMLRAHILLAYLVIGIVVGRVRYKMLRDTREGHEGIDFIGVETLIFALCCGEFSEYLGIFLTTLYLANYFRRTRSEVWRVLVGISAMLFGYLIYSQPFAEIPKTIDKECIVAIIFAVLLLEGFVWKKYMKIYSYISSAAIVIVMFVYAMATKSVLYYADGGLMANAIGMISFFLIISAVVWGIGFVLKNEIYNITAGVLLIISSIMTGSLRSPVIGIIVLLIGGLYGFYLYKKEEKILFVLPLLQMYCFLLVHKPMPQMVWIGVFIISLGVGFVYYPRIYTRTEDEKNADWFTILSVIPSLVFMSGANDKWVFCGEMMFAIFILCFYRRIGNEMVDKLVLSGASAVVAIALISQPFFDISNDWNTEWILAISWAAILINSQIIYGKSTEKVKYILMFIAAVISVLWQGVEAIETDRPADAIILGVCMAAMLLYSFYAKKEMWFFLSAITLVVQGIYATREFWKSLGWWIYVLVLGVIFIGKAAKNEYDKHNQSENEKKPFTNWSIW